jgi:hypothetical protein
MKILFLLFLYFEYLLSFSTNNFIASLSLVVFLYSAPIVLLLLLFTKNRFFLLLLGIQAIIFAYISFENPLDKNRYKVFYNHKVVGNYIKVDFFKTEDEIVDLSNTTQEYTKNIAQQIGYTLKNGKIVCHDRTIDTNLKNIDASSCGYNLSNYNIIIHIKNSKYSLHYKIKNSSKNKKNLSLKNDYKLINKTKVLDELFFDRVDRVSARDDGYFAKRYKDSVKVIFENRWQEATLVGKPKLAVFNYDKIFAVYHDEPKKVYILKPNDKISKLIKKTSKIIEKSLLKWWQIDNIEIEIDKKSLKRIAKAFKKVATKKIIDINFKAIEDENSINIYVSKESIVNHDYIFSYSKNGDFKKFYIKDK